jgi:CheY-like chemotaxis protein
VRILVAEDDPGLRSVRERGLQENGYAVDAVADGSEALAYLRTYDYAAAVVDRRMPRLSGLEAVEQARAHAIGTPILMLRARDTTSDRVSGLGAGTDDYLVKPFEFPELLARLRALLRRPAGTATPVLTCGDLKLDRRAGRSPSGPGRSPKWRSPGIGPELRRPGRPERTSRYWAYRSPSDPLATAIGTSPVDAGPTSTAPVLPLNCDP